MFCVSIRVPASSTLQPDSGMSSVNSGRDASGGLAVIQCVLWAELEEAQLEVDEFDTLFSRPVVKPKAKKENDKKEEKAKKATVAKYFDQKKSQDIGIFIRSKHLEMGEVENAIYNLDNSVIDFETLVQISNKKETVTAEELELVKANSELGPDAPPLDSPEQFILVRF